MLSTPQLSPSTAFLLVYHGSRDPRPQEICNNLANFLQQKLLLANQSHDTEQLIPSPASESQSQNSGYFANTALLPSPTHSTSLVKAVPLELGKLPLHQNIVQFAQNAIALGKKQLVIVPLFLSLGVHVTQDIPLEIALAQNQLPSAIKIHLSASIGTYRGLGQLLLENFQQHLPSPRILLAHGSRLTKANQRTKYLAHHCQAQVAYWTQKPRLETVIESQLIQNPRQITILPYFLFPGRITDAIAQQIAELQQQIPSTKLILLPPIGNLFSLAQLIFDNTII